MGITKDMTVALIGNPNSGKSTLFNSLTGLNQRTGNYPGVTVDKHTGHCRYQAGDNTFQYSILDLPGTYSLFPKSLDEEVACKALVSENKEKPDVVVIVADASNMKRHLLLATQVMDLKMPCVLALNMIDEAEKKHIGIDVAELEKVLGIDVIPINSRDKQGLQELKKAISEAKTPYVEFFHRGQLSRFPSVHSYRQLIAEKFDQPLAYKEFEAADNMHRYSQINYIIAKCFRMPEQASRSLTQRLDALFTHRVWGYVFFLLVLFIIFQFIFFIAEYPMSWIENGFSKLMELTAAALPSGKLNDLLVNGVMAGLSGIVVFVPQIALLFFFIAILEDTGYMARVSFILDRLMRRFGLNGRSVIPMISSVACAVPSIMSTRTISNWKERFITILVTPLISCSARLPVYTLLISMMFAADKHAGFFNYSGIVLMGMYLLGFAAALLAAFILRFALRAKEKSYFIMELPVYRKPQWQTVGVTVFGKIKVFLWDAGKIIMAISIVLWFLTSHAPGDRFSEIEKKYAEEHAIRSYRPDSTDYKRLIASEKLEASYAGILGKKIEPAIHPLGFDWKIGIALITSFAAREVFVGTMATIYSAGDSDNNESIRQKMENEVNPETGKLQYTNAVCWSLLIFYAFAMQCMSTLATTYRETKHWKWPLLQLLFMTGLAYLSSFAVYSALS